MPRVACCMPRLWLIFAGCNKGMSVPVNSRTCVVNPVPSTCNSHAGSCSTHEIGLIYLVYFAFVSQEVVCPILAPGASLFGVFLTGKGSMLRHVPDILRLQILQMRLGDAFGSKFRPRKATRKPGVSNEHVSD